MKNYKDLDFPIFDGLPAVQSISLERDLDGSESSGPRSIDTMLLLPDGTVMAAGADSANVWYRLTPDSSGSYINAPGPRWRPCITRVFTMDRMC